MKILNWLFGPKTISFKTGALKSPQDTRTVAAVAVQVPVALPDDFTVPTSPVEAQTSTDCVGQGIKGIKEDFLLDAGNYVALESLDLYNQCKEIDGIPEQSGTYPLVGAKVATSIGIASKAVYATGDKIAIAADRAKYKLGGYMAVGTTYDQVCQAIFQNKRITASFLIGNDWFLGIITRVLQIIGRHYTKLHGFYRPKTIVRGQNSWGIGWIGKVAGFLDSSLAFGHFDVYWPDVSDSVTDIFAFTDNIPTPVLDHVKSLNYHFDTPMQTGMQNYEVMQLQKRLAAEGFWPQGQSFTGFYGSVTAVHLFAYQMAHKVITDASESDYGRYCGPRTLRMLNGEVGLDEVSAQIQVESNGNDYAVGDLNLSAHAYGCLQIRQGICDDLNAKLGTQYISKDTLGNRALSLEIRKRYFSELYPQFTTREMRAKAWNGGPGYQQHYGKPGYMKYTAALDAYWLKMRSMMA